MFDQWHKLIQRRCNQDETLVSASALDFPESRHGFGVKRVAT